MAFTFKPGIARGAVFYELPRPILSVRVQDAWDFEQFKVPLADGDQIVGHSQEGIDISLEGQIGSQSGMLKATEETMFTELQTLRGHLDVASVSDLYSLFLYHDAASATYRKFKNCSTVRFEYDLSNPALFTYSVVIHAADPVLYSTSPGS